MLQNRVSGAGAHARTRLWFKLTEIDTDEKSKGELMLVNQSCVIDPKHVHRLLLVVDHIEAFGAVEKGTVRPEILAVTGFLVQAMRERVKG